MTRLLPLVILLALSGCPSGDDDDSVPPEPDPPSAGEDLDERETRELAADYELPPEFGAALDTLGLEESDLSYPDAGATFAEVETRLHWTDTLRHDGVTAPVFAHMVAADVEAALASEAEDTRVRELLVAQHTYNDRDAYVTCRYDVAYTVEGDDQPLLTALREFYEHSLYAGEVMPEEPWEAHEAAVTAAVEAFPFATQAALAMGIRGLLRAAELRDEALVGSGIYSAAQWEQLQETYWNGGTDYFTYTHDFGTDAHPAVDFEALARAGQLAVRAVESMRVALAEAPLADGQRLELTGSLGTVILDLEEGADEYVAGEYFLIVDGGGDDTYRDQVAVNTRLGQPISVVLDLGGDDLYRASGSWTIDEGFIPMLSTRMQGAGLFGIAVLDDAWGADTYRSAGVCQGIGVFGVGVLIDHGGMDRYEGYYHGQGHGQFGYGLLVDLGPDADEYETLQTSQGYGGPRGIGWLVDEGGDDTYLAVEEPIIWDWAGEGTNWTGGQGFGYGVRDGFFTPGDPIFSGGLGALLDLDGHDDYQCAVMCQGFGYAFGTGLLYDATGDDDYLVTHKYAMGSATHWAVGLHLDGDGADTYRNSGDDECIALGYDASVAFQIDRGEGDDVYTIDNVGSFTLGASRIPALGVLINEGGDDEYHVPGGGTRAIGRTYTADGNRDGYLGTVESVGMFFDLGGAGDLYDIAREDVGNGLEWIQTDPDGGDWNAAYDFGFGLDVD